MRTDVGGRRKVRYRRPFKPRSRFPELIYEWTNWVFSCRHCNGEHKPDKWPASGYVDPCADGWQERPDIYFAYDLLTGEIIPDPSLEGDARRKAETTINDLGLNLIDVRFYRFHAIQQFIADLRSLQEPDRQAFLDFFISRPVEYAGSATIAASQLRDAP